MREEGKLLSWSQQHNSHSLILWSERGDRGEECSGSSSSRSRERISERSGREDGVGVFLFCAVIHLAQSARENRLQLPDSCGSGGNEYEVQVVREREAGREDDAIWPDWEEEGEVRNHP